jgi:hypothetical protein
MSALKIMDRVELLSSYTIPRSHLTQISNLSLSCSIMSIGKVLGVQLMELAIVEPLVLKQPTNQPGTCPMLTNISALCWAEGWLLQCSPCQSDIERSLQFLRCLSRVVGRIAWDGLTSAFRRPILSMSQEQDPSSVCCKVSSRGWLVSWIAFAPPTK